MRPKVQCGVIGAGWWATFAHIPALLAHPDAELIAIQNDDGEEVQKIAGDFSIPHAYTAVEDLLAIDGLRAVVVSSSPNLHHRDARAALSKGKHVLIEKPMTMTTAQAQELLRLAEEANVRFLISAPWHYTEHAQQARQLIRSGKLGKVRMISMLMTNPVGDLLRGTNNHPTHGTPYMHPRSGTYSDPRIAGGGQIYAQVCHAAAYLTFLTGARASEVFAQVHNDGAQLDIYDAVVVRMDDSAIVTIASTGATSIDRRDFEVRIFGTEGILFLDLWRGRMECVSLHGEKHSWPGLPEDSIYPHQAPAKNLIDCIDDPGLNRSPAVLGVAAMEVIEGALRSAKSNSNVLVSSLQGNSDE